MGHNGEALLVLMPHERDYVQLLAARGITLQEESLVGALRWLPPPPEREARNSEYCFGGEWCDVWCDVWCDM
jgi:hypothetical protein